jgi:trehalose 6-phosphate synthase/phosphatase
MARLILVSNRLPVTLRRGRSGTTEVVQSSGGLIAGLGPVHMTEPSLWFGYPGENVDPAASERLEGQRFVGVPVPASEMRGYYQGYSNTSIWPLFHYMPDRAAFDGGDFKSYRRVNERFADAIAERAEPEDTIWVHDYQLLLLPAMLRERLPGARIGFFLHIPFPSSEIFGILPQREEILRGLIGADLIGVHTYDYARHVVSSFRRFLGISGHEGVLSVDGRSVRIAVHPLGIDVDDMQRKAFSRAAETRLAGLRRDMEGRQLILGVDRLDYTKGLPLKLEAFRLLLSRSSAWRDKVVLVQIAVPTRTGLVSYLAQKAEVERLVGEINGAYGRPGRVPVQYTYGSVSPSMLGALYRAADICLVTPLRDGMNLVAKEYIACQEDGDGLLVISEFAGAAAELGEAVRVNPHDVEGTAAALQEALEMPAAERHERMRAMYRRVRANDVNTWYRRFRRALERRPLTELASPPLTEPAALAQQVAPALRKARRPLFLLDYDGTLREFALTPPQAAPTPEVLSILRTLLAVPGSRVVVVSGRDRDSLQAWLGDTGVGLVAEHGAWSNLTPDGEWVLAPGAGAGGWKPDVRAILDEFVDRVPGAAVEEKQTSLAWHFRAAEEALANWQSRELVDFLEEFLANQPLEILEGARVVEVRQQGLDKGAAYARIRDTDGPFDFELAIGDDRTDEDLFAALGPGAFTIHVGTEPSRAKMALASPVAVRVFLRALAASTEAQGGR